MVLNLHRKSSWIVLLSVVQKKTPATTAAEYKKTDEAQPDVKEEEEEEGEEEEKAEEAEKSSPGYNDFFRKVLISLCLICLSLTRQTFLSATEEKSDGEDNPEEEEDAEKEDEKEATADEVRRFCFPVLVWCECNTAFKRVCLYKKKTLIRWWWY